MIKTMGLTHINLHVNDIERSLQFYEQVFGLELLHRYEGPMGSVPFGKQVALSTPGRNDVIALSEVEGRPIGPGGLVHFGFNLENDDDLEDAIRQVEAAGGRLLQRGEGQVDGITERFAYIADPDGYCLELNAQKILLGRKRL
jgi:catechol 2,3-dioxygenase-like lactoylglutathione lyase family enzyme